MWGKPTKKGSIRLQSPTSQAMKGPKFGGMGMKDVFNVTLAQEMSSCGMSAHRPMDLSQKGLNLSRKRSHK